MANRLTFTRRAAIASAALAALPGTGHSQTPASSPVANAPTFQWPEPVQLNDSISVIDWRLFPVDGELKFIAEIRNHSNEIVVAPVVGVVIDDLPTDGNYGWGTPFTNVIYPGESTFILGVAPSAVESDMDWGIPNWIICEEIENPEKQVEAVTAWDYEFETFWDAKQPDWLECRNVFTNKSDQRLRRMELPGIVRDADGRICGAAPISSLARIDPGETVELFANVRPSYEMLANPFNLISDITGGSASFSVQEPLPAIIPGCPAVMPWNRDG